MFRHNHTVITLIAILFSMLAGQVWGTDYYVSDTGAGTTDGLTYANRCNDVSDPSCSGAGAGDTVFLCGTFTEKVSVQGSGTGTGANMLSWKSCTVANGASTDDPAIISDTGDTHLILVDDREYVLIDGITLNGNTTTDYGINITTDSDYITIRNMVIHDTEKAGIVSSGTSSNFTIHNNTIYNVCTACDIDPNVGGAIVINGGSNTVYNNTIYDCGNGTEDIRGISFDTGVGGSIYNNSITNTSQACIEGGFFDSGTVYNNWCDGEGGENGIEFKACDGTVVSYNIILNAGSSIGDGDPPGNIPSENLYLYNNTFYGSYLSIDTNGGSTMTLKNNIFSNNDDVYTYHIYWNDDSNMADNITIDYNLYDDNNGSYPDIGLAYEPIPDVGYTLAELRTLTSDEANGVEGDPLFISATDFHLQSGSPAIDQGTFVDTE